MSSEEKDIVRELKQKFNEDEKVILEMIRQSKKRGYDLEKIKMLIQKFEQTNSCY